MKMPGFIKFYLGEGGRRGLGRKTGGVLQANGVKKEILEIVLKLNIYIQLCSVHSAFNCRTYLKPKLFLSQTPKHIHTFLKHIRICTIQLNLAQFNALQHHSTTLHNLALLHSNFMDRQMPQHTPAS